MTIYLVQYAEKERIPGDPSTTELGESHASRTGVWASGPDIQSTAACTTRYVTWIYRSVTAGPEHVGALGQLGYRRPFAKHGSDAMLGAVYINGRVIPHPASVVPADSRTVVVGDSRPGTTDGT